MADEFLAAATAAGAKLSTRQFTTDKATDFRGVLTAVKGTAPDVVFYGGMDAQGGPMLKQMQQLNMASKFMGVTAFARENFQRSQVLRCKADKLSARKPAASLPNIRRGWTSLKNASNRKMARK
ncbi:hypothetical protein [Paraburkholderia ginsengiterrae]|uniref:hypothetical protein n=1 Tax=Paraburkholderia ginsengiterrae TaxID=1462993 RepID=UPI0030FE3BF9